MSKFKKSVSILLVVAMLVGTFACLGGVVSFKVKAAEPTFTNLVGKTTTPGQHGTIKTAAQLDADHPSGWMYLYGETFELPEGAVLGSDWESKITPTDGYVKSGQYVIVKTGYANSSGFLTGMPLFWLAHSYDFFENIAAPLATQDVASNAASGQNDMANYGAQLNWNSPYVTTSTIGLNMKVTTFATPASTPNANVTKSGYTAAQLDTIGFTNLTFLGSTMPYAGDFTWVAAVAYKVKAGLADGTMGSLFIPQDLSDANKGFWKLPNTSGAIVTKHPAYLSWSNLSDTTAKLANFFKGDFVVDYGATFIIGEKVTTSTVTFYDSDKVTVLGTKANIAAGGSCALTDAPAVENPTGGEFAGWVDAEGKAVTFPISDISSDISVYASYNYFDYKITFYDGTVSVGEKTYKYGQTVSAIYNPTKIGYSFDHWNPALPGTMPDQNISVNAVWNANKHNIYYYLDGDLYRKFEDVEYGTDLTGTDYKFDDPSDKDGQAFSGWTPSLPNTMPDADVEINGSYDTLYTISFIVRNPDNSTTCVKTMAYKAGQATEEITEYSYPPANIAGYVFDGWDITNYPSSMGTENIEILGSYSPAQFNVTYEVDGVDSAPVKVSFKNAVNAIEGPEKEGYTFDKWVWFNDDTKEELEGKPDTMPAYNLRAVAVFTVNQYTVTYRVQGDIFGEVETYDFGDALTERTATKKITGQNFVKWIWNTSDEKIPEKMPAKHLTAVASYEIGTYDAKFNLNGGNIDGDTSAVTVPDVTFGSPINAPANPEKTGYNFSGWTPAVGTMDAEGKNFSATWTAKTFNINLYLDKDAETPYTTVVATYDKVFTITNAADKPSKANMKFVNWVNKDTEDVLAGSMNTPFGTSKFNKLEDVNLYATWSELSTFTFFIQTEDGQEWVEVGSYNTVTSKTAWNTIVADTRAKFGELGYTVKNLGPKDDDDNDITYSVLNRELSPMWFTNEELNEGKVYFDGYTNALGRDSDLVKTDDTEVSNINYYLKGERKIVISLKDEDGEVVKTIEQWPLPNENGLTAIEMTVAEIEELAPRGQSFTGKFYNEDDEEIETIVHNDKYGNPESYEFRLTGGSHDFKILFEDIRYRVIFRIGKSLSEFAYSREFTLEETLDITKPEDFTFAPEYEELAVFPALHTDIIDLTEEPEKSVDYYDYTLDDYGFPGQVLKQWICNQNKDIILDDETSTLEIDDETAKSFYRCYDPRFEGDKYIYFDCDLVTLYYEATFKILENGKFPDDSLEKKMWLEYNTTEAMINQLATEKFGGDPISTKEGYSFVGWRDGDSTEVKFSRMPNKPFTYVARIAGALCTVYYLSEAPEGELDYEALVNGEIVYYYRSLYAGESAEGIETGPDKNSFSSAVWKPYSLLNGWTLLNKEITVENSAGYEKTFTSKTEDGKMVNNMVFVPEYTAFEDCLLIIYDSNTSYLLGSILEPIIGLERQFKSLSASEPAEPAEGEEGEEAKAAEPEKGKIEDLVGDYTGLTIEQILSQNTVYNKNIYKTVGKDLKIRYWKDGEQVSRKEAKLNPDDSAIVIMLQFKLVNFKLKELFKADMWKHVYIAARPVLIHKSTLDPRQTATTISTIVTLVKSLLG